MKEVKYVFLLILNSKESQPQQKSSETESMWQSFMEIHKDTPVSENHSHFSPFEAPSEAPQVLSFMNPHHIKEPTSITF